MAYRYYQDWFMKMKKDANPITKYQYQALQQSPNNGLK